MAADMQQETFGFRKMFYLVTPNETSFETIEEVPNYVAEALPYFFVLVVLECIVLVLQGKKSRLPRWNDAFSSVGAGVFSQLHGLLFRSTELAAYIWVYNRYRILDLPWDNPWTWFAAFVGVDFCYYWVHRCGHETNALWAAHQTHHSSEDYNLTTALRQSIWLRYLSWVFYLPMALCIPPSAFLVHNQFNLLYQFWIHTETIKKLGPLEWILNTPSHHRVHHGRNPYCIDKNYGGTLIIFDRIFGTFQAEKEEVIYGLVHPLASWDPVYTQFGHLEYMVKKFWSIPGIENKLSVIFKGPGWDPGKPWTGLPEDIPEVEKPVMKYDKDVGFILTIYSWIHFLLLIVALNLLAKNNKVIPADYMICCVAFLVLSLTCIGALYENWLYAFQMETVRCMFFLAMFNTSSLAEYLALAGVASLVNGLFLVSLAGCIMIVISPFMTATKQD